MFLELLPELNSPPFFSDKAADKDSDESREKADMKEYAKNVIHLR